MNSAKDPVTSNFLNNDDDDDDDDLDGQNTYLVVGIDDELYAICVSSVSEIVRMPKVTPVVHVGRHFRGVVNLRGRILPVLDLASRLHGRAAQVTERSMLIVVDNDEPASFMVDSVKEVIAFDPAQFDPLAISKRGPDDARLLIGLARHQELLIVVLDVVRLIALEFTNTMGEQAA